MITFRDFSYRYAAAESATLRDVDLTVETGDFALVVGGTGSGKSTLLRALYATAGDMAPDVLSGVVSVDGLDARGRGAADLDPLVGVVRQEPRSGFIAATVEGEIVARLTDGPSPGLAPGAFGVRRRLEEVLDLLGIEPLRDRHLDTLSGGEQQRVALAAALALSPRVLVLDEPTSALDPAAAEDVLAAVLRLVHEVGITVLAAEHRLERVVEYADQLVVVEAGRCYAGRPADLLASATSVPPVVELGRLCGWTPLPLSVRDARRHAPALRSRLAFAPPPPARVDPPGEATDGLDARGVVVRRGGRTALRGADLQVRPGEVVALMGRNGSGKSSLLAAVAGCLPRAAGSVRVAGRDPARMSPRQREALALALVPQHDGDAAAAALTVRSICASADAAADAIAGLTEGVFWRLCGDETPAAEAAACTLSEGQRVALAVATRLAARPRLLLLDEPTRGLDYGAKARLSALLTELASERAAVVVATHDVEFVARTADRVVVLAEGEVVADGSTREVLAASPIFAPQIAKVLAPQDWLTTGEVAAALRASATGSADR